MADDYIEINNAGDHDPPFPYMLMRLDGRYFGMHVDLSKVTGDLFDAATVSRVVWGLLSPEGRHFGQVEFKSGQAPRRFWDGDLMIPYTNAFHMEREARGFIDDAGPHLKRQQ